MFIIYIYFHTMKLTKIYVNATIYILHKKYILCRDFDLRKRIFLRFWYWKTIGFHKVIFVQVFGGAFWHIARTLVDWTVVKAAGKTRDFYLHHIFSEPHPVKASWLQESWWFWESLRKENEIRVNMIKPADGNEVSMACGSFWGLVHPFWWGIPHTKLGKRWISWARCQKTPQGQKSYFIFGMKWIHDQKSTTTTTTTTTLGFFLGGTWTVVPLPVHVPNVRFPNLPKRT